jgi:transposase
VEHQAQEPLRVQEQCEKARSVASMRLELRQKLTRPRPGPFKAWLESQQAQSGGPVLPKRPLGQAIGDCLNPWAALCVYCTDGELGIDNNISERALRRIAVGRNNRMFCNSDHGGNTAVTLLGLMATCERHEVNLFDDLRDVVGRIAARPISGLEELLPGQWKAAGSAAESVPVSRAAQG